jgi:predicted Zn-dependent peptidase
MRNLEEYKKIILVNGLTVHLQKTFHETVYTELRFDHATAHEQVGEEGLAHFLEHLVISGGGNRHSPDEIKIFRDFIPFTNAFTNHTRTRYASACLPEDLDLCLNVFSDTCFNPKLDEGIVEQERQRVLREIAGNRGIPEFEDVANLNARTHGKDHPICQDIGGTEEAVSRFNKQDLLNFHSRGYSPNNAQLVLVGNLSETLIDSVEKYFGDLPKGQGEKAVFDKLKQFKEPGILHTYAKDLQNVSNLENSNSHLTMLFVAEPLDSENYFSAKMLSMVLGQGRRSKVFQKVSKEMGLAYSIGTGYFDKYPNTGYIELGGSIASTKQEEAIEAIFRVFIDLQEIRLPEVDLDNFKRSFRYRTITQMQDTAAIAKDITRRQVQHLDIEEYIEKLEAVTPEDVRIAANKYLPRSRKHNTYLMMLRDPLKE